MGSAVDQVKAALNKMPTAGDGSGSAASASTAPAKPAAPKPVAKPKKKAPKLGGVVEPIMRPNGDLYYPRQMATHTDVLALRAAREKGINLLLAGRPGAGKTALAEAAYEGLVTLSGTGDTEVSDFVGGWKPTEDAGTYEWEDGPLVVAMENGLPLLLDDATLIAPKVVAVVYPAMDGRGEITVSQRPMSAGGTKVKAKEGFYVIAAHNPGAPGAVLSEALASRFHVHLEVPTDYSLARHLRVPNKAVKLAENLERLALAGDVDWVPQMRELLAFRDISETFGEDVAVANFASLVPEMERETVLRVVSEVFGRPVKPLALGGQV